ncbi:ribonuclease III [Rhodobacteraceae bacterium NNCM2]|nr:ribonuclease III [Coraliihabitans acroporae]
MRRDILASIEEMEDRLRHRFARRELLTEALTHPSAGTPARPDNQRLEFVGDRVLGLVIAEALLNAFKDETEGSLAPRLNALVRRETLAEIANEIELGAYLHLGRSENTSGGRRKSAILADAMEAVIAALYLDGGLEVARRFIQRHWQRRIEAPGEAPTDAKTQLQEWAQGKGMAPPTYEIKSRSGPDHAPTFTVEARVETGLSAEGTAGSRKRAEQIAAAALIAQIGEPS